MWISPSQTFAVIVAPPPRDRRAPATVEFDAMRITIHPRQPIVAQHVSLWHELAHIVERKARREGLIRRPWSDRLVEHVAINLFGIVALSGLYRSRGAFTVEDVREHFAELDAAHRGVCRVCDGKKDPTRPICATCEELAGLTAGKGDTCRSQNRKSRRR